jgi:hypothetical protein
MKIVDAHRDGIGLVGAKLRVARMELITESPMPHEVVPFWAVQYELRAGQTKFYFSKQMPYQADTDPLQAAELGVFASDLTDWTVTRFENEP